MADNNKPPEQRIGATAEVARSGTAEARTTASAVDKLLRGAQAGTSAAERASQSTPDALHRSGQVGAEVVRGAGEIADHVSKAGAEAAQRGDQARAEMVHEAGTAARQATEAAAESGQRLAASVQSGTEEMWRFMAMPGVASRGLQDMQQVFAGLLENAIRTNLRVTQELFRLVNPGAVMELQRRFALRYLDAVTAGQAAMFRTAWRTAEEAPRPTERQSGQGRS